MIFYILAFFIALMFLKLLNYLLTKNKFALDGILAEDSHKKFANLNTSVPLSGALYFTPLVFFFNLNDLITSKILNEPIPVTSDVYTGLSNETPT